MRITKASVGKKRKAVGGGDLTRESSMIMKDLDEVEERMQRFRQKLKAAFAAGRGDGRTSPEEVLQEAIGVQNQMNKSLGMLQALKNRLFEMSM